jgi:hypothetical protein
MLPHWLTWALMTLGVAFLLLGLSAGLLVYLVGLLAATVMAVWARRTFRVSLLERSPEVSVVRIERRRPRPVRRLLLLAGAALLVALGGLIVLVHVTEPEAAPHLGWGGLHDAGPLPAMDKPSGVSHIEPTYGHAAFAAGNIGTEVRCWSVADWEKRESEWAGRGGRALGEWGAYTNRWGPSIPNAYRIQLSPSICATLARLAYGDVPARLDPWPEALAWSVSALAHEAQHAAGITDEATAECSAVQKIAITAQALGRSASEGRYLADLYWRESYLPRGKGPYRSDECRDGGRLDLNPETSAWP